MGGLPVTYRIPRDLLRYLVVLAVVVSGFVGLGLWAAFVADEILLAALLAMAAAWTAVFVRCRWLGTTVTKDGITRNRLFGNQRLAWQDVTDWIVQEGTIVVVANFQVTSRYRVHIRTRHSRRKALLLFLDERAFGHDAQAFVAELNTITAFWEQHRHPDAAA